MAEKSETRVLYKAIADFSDLSRAARQAKKDLRDLRDEERKGNAQSAADSTKVVRARKEKAAAATEEVSAVEKVVNATQKAAAAANTETQATERSTRTRREARTETGAHARETTILGRALENVAAAANRSSVALDRTSTSTRRNRSEFGGLGNTMQQVTKRGESMNKAFTKLGHWRPRLIPPFIALIPVIGSILGLINPLVAGLGAVGAAALGFASNLGSIAGAALGAVPAIATLISVVGALKMAFGGFGGAFKAFSAAKKAGGGGGGGAPKRAELTMAEEITRAQEKLRRAYEDVQYAEEDLNEARKESIQRLEALRKAVDRAAMSEARARANAQLSRENYANVLADPGSTKGQKMDAQVSVEEARVEVSDVIEENKKNLDEYQEAQRKGVEGDREVIMAQRRLTDAMWAVRDAQLALANAKIGDAKAGGGAASAADAYREALEKLSPSARRVVEYLISLEEQWIALRKNVQEAFFSEFVDDITLLERLLPPLNSMLSDTAGALGRVFSALIRELTSDAWLSDIEALGKQNIPIIKSMGDAFISVLNVIRDLTFAAGPFAVKFADALARGADNLERIVGNARETGRLETWLSTVYDRMAQWWRIIKNVGATLFNYSAAAGDFGQGLTDSLEGLTERWRANSEAAREVGSPFRKFLEDISPLLSEVSGLFGDFFRWFGEEATDPANIATFTEIISMIRDDLGPALGRILDSLAANDHGTDLVEALVTIFETLAEFLENGGAEAMGEFWKTLVAILNVFKSIISVMPPQVLGAIVGTLGTLAAMRFMGLNVLIGGLLKLARSSGVLSKLFGAIAGTKVGAGVSRALFGGGGRHAAGGAAEATGRRAAGGSAANRSAGFFGGMGRGGAEGGAKGFGGRLAGRAAGAKGGVVAMLASLVIGTIADEAIKDGNKGTRDTGGSILSGAATGAGIGALAGSVIPGVGTAVGAAAGAVVGGGAAALGIDGEQWTQTTEEIKNWWNTSVVEPLGLFASSVGTWWTENITTPLGEFALSVGTWWTENIATPLSEFALGVSAWWTENILTPWLAFTDMMGRLWNEFVILPFQELSWAIGSWWQENVINPWNAMAASVGAWWNERVVVPFQAAAGAISSWWSTQVVSRWTAVADSVGSWWNTSVVTRWNAAIDSISSWWSANVATPAGNFFSGLASWWSDNVAAPFKSFANKISNFDLSDTLTGMFNSVLPGKHNGGVIKRNGGGEVPGSGNSDVVPAMLTPGEFVIRKAIVNRIGEDNLASLNAGAMGFGSMLRKAQAKAPGRHGVLGLNGGGLVPAQAWAPSASNVPATAFAGAGTGNIDRGFHVENLNVNNPVPESASDSLPKTIRKVSYLGGGR